MRPADDPAAQRQEAVTGLLAEAEDAKKAGDAERLNAILGKIDKLVEQEQPRNEAGQWTSFGGGVRRPVPPPTPSVSDLMRQALRQVQQVRAASTMLLTDDE